MSKPKAFDPLSLEESNATGYPEPYRPANQTRWNRRQAAKILKISYKALLNKLKAMEEQQVKAQTKHEEIQ